jgi:putative DNA primase/helicase
VIAALTILRAYQLAGRPNQGLLPWGGFEDWSSAIREVVIWVGLPDPCKTREIILADDPEREELHSTMLTLHEAFAGSEFTVKEVVNRCTVNGVFRKSVLFFAARRDSQDEVDPNRLGWLCRRLRDRVVGGLRLRYRGSFSGAARWQIEEVPTVGHGGHRGHLPAFEDTSPSVFGSESLVDDPGHVENAHHDHLNLSDPEDGDEVAV